MSLLDMLKQYAGGSAPTSEADVHQHFDQVAQSVPQSDMAGALSHAFRSDQTPAFGQMVSSMFSQSNGEQKAGMLNHLLASVGPAGLAQIPGGSMLSGLLSGGSIRSHPNKRRTFLQKPFSNWLRAPNRRILRSSKRPARFMRSTRPLSRPWEPG